MATGALAVVFKICFPSLVGQHWNSAFSKFSMNLLPLGVDELWIFPLEQEIVVSALPGNYVGTALSGCFLQELSAPDGEAIYLYYQ